MMVSARSTDVVLCGAGAGRLIRSSVPGTCKGRRWASGRLWLATVSFRIRQAALEDLSEAATVKARAWRESYPHFPDSVFETQDSAVAQTAEAWDADARRGHYFWIVTDTSLVPAPIVGVAHACPARDADAPASLELAMLYLLDVAKGSGIADRLMEMTIGDSPAYLWVIEDNERAISFYEKHGFVRDGATRPLRNELAQLNAVRMARA